MVTCTKRTPGTFTDPISDDAPATAADAAEAAPPTAACAAAFRFAGSRAASKAARAPFEASSCARAARSAIDGSGSNSSEYSASSMVLDPSRKIVRETSFAGDRGFRVD